MAQEYYNLEKAAEVLGITPAELVRMRERGDVRAFRDSGDWKFKTEEVQRLAAELKSRQEAEPEGEAEDVLLSEVELGQSDASGSGTVIGSSAGASEESDIKLAGSDVGLESGGEEKEPAEAKPADVDELDLTLDEDVPLEDSQVSLADTGGVKEGSGGSGAELADELEDDELVLGGSGSGSDVTIGQDSGISLVDPQDSGLSLDEPMELASDDESLALGEDDMLTLSEEAVTESPTQLKTDDDFLLTPMEEEGVEEESESGSQVIALDTTGEGEEAVTLVAEAPGAGMAAMLDEEVTADAGVAEAPFAVTVPGVGAPQPAAAGAPLTPGAVALPEAPFGTLAMIALSVCVLLLVLSGIMVIDLARNMWSWGGEFGLNSSLMDFILGLLPG